MGLRSFSRRLLFRERSPSSQGSDNPWIGVDGGNGFGAKKLLRVSSDSFCPNQYAAGEPALKDIQVLTRYCAIERPYWFAFLTHYASMGVRVVHACVQNDFDYQDIVDADCPDGLKVICHRISGDLDPSSALQSFNLSAIKKNAPLTLLVDCDEYLQSSRPDLPLSLLCDAFSSVGQFYLPWLMAPVLDKADSANLGFWGHIGKPVVRSCRMDIVANDHAFRLDNCDANLSKDSAPLGVFGFSVVHFWSRSFRDCLLKTFNNRFQDSKSADLSIALKKIRSNDLPNRLKLLAFLCVQHKFIPVSVFPRESIQWQEEEALLRDCLSEADEKLCRKTFDRYCRQLEESYYLLPIYPAIALKTAVDNMPDVLP